MSDLISAIWKSPDQRPEFQLREWETVIGQAFHARLLARLARHLVDHNWMASVPLQPRQYLEGALRLVDRQQHEVRWEVDCIRRALKDVSSPVVLLKGAAYLIAGLPPGKGRLFSDIDILVKHESMNEVENALFSSGWITEENDAYNTRYYRQWMHEIPPMRHVQRNTIIDVHHTITPPTSRYNVKGKQLFDCIVPIDKECKLFVLSPQDMVLHSAVHLFQEGEFSHGLRDLLDINDLLAHFSKEPRFWAHLVSRAKELRLGEPLFHALHHTQRLFGTNPPVELSREFHELQPHWLTRKILGGLLQLALSPQHPSCHQRFSGFARWLLYVRSHYLRMPWHLVIPHLLRKAWMRQFPEKREVFTAQ